MRETTKASTTAAVTPPLFSRQALVALILPLLAEQFLSVSMGMADTIMVSGVGEAAVSSVSLVDSINVLIIQVLSALATGGAVVSSQYLGRKDGENAQRSAAQLYTVLAGSTLVAAVATLLFCVPILRGVFGSIDADVMAYAEVYFLISAISYPFMGIYNAGAALFRAQGNSRISMLASLVMNIINIVGNALLIYVFHLGVMGAALATLAGRVFAAIWVTWQQQQLINPLRIPSLAAMKPDKKMIRSILGIGIPAGLENGMFQIGKLVISHLTSTLGTAAIAANAVANAICGMANIPGNAMSLAMIPVVGRCLGAGERGQARSYSKKLLGLSFLGIWAANLAVYFTIPWLVGLFSLSPQAASLCITVVRGFNLFSAVCWPFSFTLPNALRTGGDARFTMTVSIVSMWLFRVLLCYVFVLQFGLGLNAIWLGMYVDWACRSLWFIWRFHTDKWMEHKVI
ncbi:MAG: MATE family efflux transporter [Gemmiger sp.]|nr:MATE family efflux transporter [Gemmiger sp.]